MQGAYTYQSMVNRMARAFDIRQKKVQFVEEIIGRKQDFKDAEDDFLLLKKSELALHRLFNSYRMPFCAFIMAFSFH